MPPRRAPVVQASVSPATQEGKVAAPVGGNMSTSKTQGEPAWVACSRRNHTQLLKDGTYADQPRTYFELLSPVFLHVAENTPARRDGNMTMGSKVLALFYSIVPTDLLRGFFDVMGAAGVGEMSAVTETLGTRKRRRSQDSEKPAHGEDGAVATTATTAAHAVRKMASLIQDDVTLRRLVAAVELAGPHHLAAFRNDSDFLAAKEVQLGVSRRSISELSTDEARIFSALECGFSVAEHLAPSTQLLAQILQAHVSARLARMTSVPRLVRLGAKLDLSSSEMEALTFLLLTECGSHLSLGVNSGIAPVYLTLLCNLSPMELLFFMRDDRPHVKQGLVCIDCRNGNSLTASRLSIPQEYVAPLTGSSPSVEQLIKLEKTALVEILRDEGTVVNGYLQSPNNTNSTKTRADGEDREAGGGGSSRHHRRGAQLGEESAASSEHSGSDHDGEADEDDEGGPPLHVSELIDSLRRGEGEVPGSPTSPAADGGVAITHTGHSSAQLMGVPYHTDIEYVEQAFMVLASIIKLRSAEGDVKDVDDYPATKNKAVAAVREIEGRTRVQSEVHQSRVAATMREKHFVPRIEKLCARLHLSDVEKQIVLLLVGNVMSHDILIAINGRYAMREGQRLITVGYLLFVLCENLQKRVEYRKAFYQSSPLVSNGIITLNSDLSGRSVFGADLADYVCDVDRKIVDYVMGIESEASDLVPGSRLYSPNVPIENVVLPKQSKDLLRSTIDHYSLYERCKKLSGFGASLGISVAGLVILFWGPSGTGKTMLANAVGQDLGKRILLVNISQFTSDGAKPADTLRFIFREARLNDAIIFFDECESIFERRESNPLILSLLSEFEKYEGLIIMATNKAQNLDEAMNRRISLMVEFKSPDHEMRRAIWAAHMPANLTLSANVSLEKLALNYEITGGLIRNAVLAALHHAVAREKTERPTLTMEDFEAGARLQLRGFFLTAERPTGVTSDFYLTPKRSLEELVVEADIHGAISTIANVAKSRSTLYAQWGFSEEQGSGHGSLYLFHGPSGTGKSLAAEGVAYECGATVRLCNVAELLLQQELNIHSVFEEARRLGAIIVFDQAQALFDHSDRSLGITQLIQYHVASYPRPVLVLATTGIETSSIDVRSTRFSFAAEVSFHLPGRSLRKLLWSKAFPEKVPLATDINWEALSDVAASAKIIRAAAFNACCKAALLPVADRVVRYEALQAELQQLILQERSRQSISSGMFV